MRLLDSVVVIVYLLGVVAVGLAFRGRKKDADSYFTAKGGFRGRLGMVVVGLSIAATLFSGISFIVYTSTAFGHGGRIILGAAGIPIAWVVLRFWFLPRFLRDAGSHPYDIIEKRYGLAPRLCVSAMFVLVRIGWMGAMLAAPTLIVMGAAGLGPEWFWPIVLLTGFACTLYTSIGGIRSVIITDAIQLLVIVAGLLFIIAFTLIKIDAPFATIVGDLQTSGRLDLLDFKFSFTETYTFWGVLIGLTVSGLGSYLADLMMLQRYMAAESPAAAARSFAVNMWGAIVVVTSLVAVGLLLWVWYRYHPDPNLPAQNDKVLAYFIAQELPPGMSGLLIAAIMAATMSSMTSGIIALAGTITNDWIGRFGSLRSSAGLFRVGRATSVIIGVVATLAGGFTAQLGSLFQVSQTVLGVFLGPMLGCMVLVVAEARVKPAGVLLGLAVGSIAGWAVVISSVSFIWVAPAASAATIAAAHLLGRPATGRSSRVGQPPSTR
jgi:solute:Na+ symporter, SSS family